MPTKSEKLKSLVDKAMEAETLYMSLVGTGHFEHRVYHAVFKWPDVVMSILESNFDQATEDVSAIILYAMRPIAICPLVTRVGKWAAFFVMVVLQGGVGVVRVDRHC